MPNEKSPANSEGFWPEEETGICCGWAETGEAETGWAAKAGWAGFCGCWAGFCAAAAGFGKMGAAGEDLEDSNASSICAWDQPTL